MKIKILYFGLALFILGTMQVNALEKEEYYFTNTNGVYLTEEQYNNLSETFSFDTINSMSFEMIEKVKNDHNLKKVVETKYIESEIFYLNGKVLTTIDNDITKKEYDNISINKKKISGKATDNHETTYKKIELEVVYGASISYKYITLTTEWKLIPSTKSYDVMAISTGDSSFSINLINQKSGYQKYDGNTINYSSNSGNWKTLSSSTAWNGGIGLSQNIVDSTTTSLKNSMTVLLYSGSLNFRVRGSYQHAISNVTLSQSKNYSISLSGLGGVIDFDSTVRGNYDNTGGLYTTLTI